MTMIGSSFKVILLCFNDILSNDICHFGLIIWLLECVCIDLIDLMVGFIFSPLRMFCFFTKTLCIVGDF